MANTRDDELRDEYQPEAAGEARYYASEVEKSHLYHKAAKILKAGLTKEEFLRLQNIWDGDSGESFFDAVTEQAAIMDPDAFYQEPEKEVNG